MPRANTTRKRKRLLNVTRATNTGRPAKEYVHVLALAAVALAALLWSFWAVCQDLLTEWLNNENYSVGLLVPLAAVYLVWQTRDQLLTCPLKPCWWGLGLVLAGLAARMFGLLQMFQAAERYALVITLSGVVLLTLGWRVFWRLKWVLLFMMLMVPLPGRVHNAIAGPLQRFATVGAVFLLEVFGLAVSNEGNTIVLNGDVHLNVAEACSGLRMLTAFVVVAATMAYVIDRPKWQKLVIFASSIPVAIACNLARLFATAMLWLLISGDLAQWFFHDLAGWTMMPLAVLLLIGELWLMAKLVLPEPEQPSRSIEAAR